MSIEQLWALREQISAILTSKMSFKKVQLEELLRKLNHSVEPRKGTLKGDRERRPYPPVVPKYRNPGRPSETWAGRGRRPRWLIAQLASGKQLDDFRIESTAR
jgi:DNA-binding protein H-NS